MLRLVSAGSGERRHLVLLSYVGAFAPLEEAIRAAAPGAVIVSDCRTPTSVYTRIGPSGAPAWPDVLKLARALVREDFEIGHTIDVGYSAGVQALRSRLIVGDQPDAVVAVDGTSGSLPPQPWQIDCWKHLATEARAHRRVFVASHTLIDTESVRPTAEHPEWRPFSSTRAILRLATGWALEDSKAGPPDAPAVDAEGSLRIEGYQGKDAHAHQLQEQVALPRMLAAAMVMLDAGLAPATSPAPAPSVPLLDPILPASPRLPNLTQLGLRALDLAQHELEDGVREDPPGSNTSHRIAEYLKGCERAGHPVGLTAGSWCAAFASWCGWMSVDDGDDVPPHLWRAAVHELVEDAKGRDAWHGPDAWMPRPGDLAVFKRSGADPTKGGEGHVARVESVIGEAIFTTIDGNHGDRVERVTRPLTDPSLVGWIAYP